MCDKDVFEAIVTCKKCRHPAQVYRNPKVGVRKDRKGAPAIVFKDENPSPEFRWWVSVVCKNQNCSQCNKSITFTFDDFKSLKPPCCCKQKMKPEVYEGFAYIYKCEICEKIIPLATWLPDLIEPTKK